ncbi:helix-turn-helix transcriptional regulator [uncultured Agrobacterium sp.]|uniref:AraC family transcriptional regulator n=1 Tax=uncultured Agrobacterium sp. TaxID=157277 RepID=UPI0025E99FEA|nr:helix-turn-helix transcriptional regulator [uncultured Agrobacterium sp.]
MKGSSGSALPLHSHDEAQLTYAASGMIQLHTGEGVWLVPPQLAVWIPAGVPHRLDIMTDAELWMVNWQPTAASTWAPPNFPNRAFASRVTPLLHSLLAAAIEDDPATVKAELMVRLRLLELSAMSDAPTYLPMPMSPVARRVAEIALGDHRNRMDLSELASRAATSVRTASRLFPMETGMTLKAWRQRARVVRTMEQLARGKAIADVANDAGFSSTAAFSFAFRQVTAATPGSFLCEPKALDSYK